MATSIITPKFIEKMRSSDYQSTSYAFAELIDNSFDAEATKIRITSIERRDQHNKRYIDEIIFSDNGTGMDDEVLNNCLTFAYGTNDDLDQVMARKKIGKFGMGLPNSSISQCTYVQVFSKQPNTVWRRKYMNIAELTASNSIELHDAVPHELPAYYSETNSIVDVNTGTIVSWKNCDQLDRQFADTLYKRSEGVLGRLFRHHLANGGEISLAIYLYNPEEDSYIEQTTRSVVVNDPLFLTPKSFITKFLRECSAKDEAIEDERLDPATYYRKFVTGLPEGESLPTSKKLEDYSYTHSFEWKGKQYRFRVKTSYADIDIQKPGIREGGKTKVGGVYGDKMKSGNIYFTRHQREISCGHYGFYNISAENNRWWGIEIDFDADADELLGVSNTKQGIRFSKTIDEDQTTIFDKHTATLQQARERLWFELSNKISKAIREVSKILSNQATAFEEAQNIDGDDGGDPVPTGTTQTTQAIKTTDRQRQGRFDEEQKQDLISTLKTKFPNLSHDEIAHAVDKFDRSLVRGCVIYCGMDGSDQLWSYSEVRGFLCIYINTNHDFYGNIIAKFRAMNFDSALTAIELFISSLAWEQNEHFDADAEKRRNLDNFRTYVGIHLNNYLQENDISVIADEVETSTNEADV